MTSKAHQGFLSILLPLLLVLIAAGGILVYAPASTILLGTAGTVLGVFPRHRSTALQR